MTQASVIGLDCLSASSFPFQASRFILSHPTLAQQETNTDLQPNYFFDVWGSPLNYPEQWPQRRDEKINSWNALNYKEPRLLLLWWSMSADLQVILVQPLPSSSPKRQSVVNYRMEWWMGRQDIFCNRTGVKSAAGCKHPKYMLSPLYCISLYYVIISTFRYPSSKVLSAFTTLCKHLTLCRVLRESASNIKESRNIRLVKWCREAAITVLIHSGIYPPPIPSSGMYEQVR